MPKTLRAQDGVDNITFATETFPIAPDGTVTVPDEAVDSLIAKGGLTEVAPPVETPEGQVRMLGDGVAGVSFRGEAYEADADGVFTVPLAAAADLQDHGLVVVED